MEFIFYCLRIVAVSYYSIGAIIYFTHLAIRAYVYMYGYIYIQLIINSPFCRDKEIEI